MTLIFVIVIVVVRKTYLLDDSNLLFSDYPGERKRAIYYVYFHYTFQIL